MIGQLTKVWAEQNQLFCIYQNPIHSTNSFAKEMSELPADRFIILTDHQTNGRGRNTNTWIQEQSGNALISSWCFFVNSFPKATLTCRIGLILYESLHQFWPQKSWSIKAPNDLYLDDKKIAGILVELIQNKNGFLLIIGIGLNVLSAPHGVPTSTSLYQEQSEQFDSDRWQQFLTHFHLKLEQTIETIDAELSESECQRLILALNRFPHLNEKYIRIFANGTLETASKTVLWSEL